ncbi:Dus-domain-containing protein [Ascobolus immersus RN42]|uniref:tRNA-dihydrouridine(16/17) synthase [NAD(P)(+)] n=1 Tax=Ascobolus immersus RN42 TaxID=1160509 RepID=A0A3N4ILI7_ASCIM|nr:Dus-domain-containing protein [Ascobolus immersus RN42]
MATDSSTQTNGAGPVKEKLFGRKFYESIGSPKYVIAPMVDQSELAWRLLTKKMTPQLPGSPPILAYTPMYHSKVFGEVPAYRRDTFPCPPHKDFPLGAAEHDRPLFVQFCSNEPDDLLRAAQTVAPYCDAVDLNLGCPQGIARKGRYGSYLQEEWDLIYKMINKLHLNLSIPVTAKIRILESKERTLEYAKMVLSAGASILTVHGRTRDQKGHNTGLADWQYIRYLRDNLPPETVLFANGNILWQEDVEACFAATGVDAVMSAECNLYNPTGVFAPVSAPWSQRFPRMDIVGRQYLDLIRTHILPPLIAKEEKLIEENETKKVVELTDESIKAIKSHFFKLFHSLLYHHSEIRAVLGKSRARAENLLEGKDPLQDFEDVLSMVTAGVKAELEKNPEQVDENGEWVGPDFVPPPEVVLKAEEMDAKQKKKEGMLLPSGLVRKVPWYRCQPYYRPLPEEALRKGALQEKMSRQEKKAVKKAKVEGEKTVVEKIVEMEKKAEQAVESAVEKAVEAVSGGRKVEPKRKAEESVEVSVGEGEDKKRIKLVQEDFKEGERQEREDREKAETACG